MTSGSSSATTCALCGGPAVRSNGVHQDYRHYECPVCVEFLITPASDRIVRQASDDVRRRLSQQAQRSDEVRICTIKRPDNPADGMEPQASLQPRR